MGFPSAAAEREYNRRYYKAHRARLVKEQRRYRAANIEHVREQQREYREENRDAIRERRHAQYVANRDKILAERRRFYVKNKAKILARGRGYRDRNREKIRERNQRYCASHPGRHRRTTYGLTDELFTAMLKKQGGRCCICRKKLIVGKNRLTNPHVDHCHTRGKVRGLLCSPCNTGIGHLKHSVKNLKRAAAYLRRHG